MFGDLSVKKVFECKSSKIEYFCICIRINSFSLYGILEVYRFIVKRQRIFLSLYRYISFAALSALQTYVIWFWSYKVKSSSIRNFLVKFDFFIQFETVITVSILLQDKDKNFKIMCNYHRRKGICRINTSSLNTKVIN